MNHPLDTALRTRMEEAILLGPADDLRLTVETEVRAAGPAAVAYWEDLLAEDDALRRHLPDVQVPVGLEGRLNALATTRMRGPPRLPRRVIAVAAAVLIAVAGFALSVGGGGTPDSFAAVAELAAGNFAADPHCSLHTSDPTRLGEELDGQLPFAFDAPDLGEDFALRGGRTCALGSAPVAYSAWNGPDGRYGLYQFDTSALELPDSAPARCIPAPTGDGGTVHVRIWSDGGQGYALVCADECGCGACGCTPPPK